MRKLILGLLMVASLVHGADVSLQWTLPTNNVDGSPLTDLAGCKVYWGTNSRNYSAVMDVPGVPTNATVTGLVAGTQFYFAGTVYNVAGNESDFSDEIVRSLLAAPAIVQQSYVRSSKRLTATWTPVPGATAYVYRAFNTNGFAVSTQTVGKSAYVLVPFDRLPVAARVCGVAGTPGDWSTPWPMGPGMVPGVMLGLR